MWHGVMTPCATHELPSNEGLASDEGLAQVKVELLYFDGCPHWATAEQRLIEALSRLGSSDVVQRLRIDSPEHAERVGFRGSPTILLDGRDPFADADSPVGFACRVYVTDSGLAGAPTIEQLVGALGRPS